MENWEPSSISEDGELKTQFLRWRTENPVPEAEMENWEPSSISEDGEPVPYTEMENWEPSSISEDGELSSIN